MSKPIPEWARQLLEEQVLIQREAEKVLEELKRLQDELDRRRAEVPAKLGDLHGGGQ